MREFVNQAESIVKEAYALEVKRGGKRMAEFLFTGVRLMLPLYSPSGEHFAYQFGDKIRVKDKGAAEDMHDIFEKFGVYPYSFAKKGKEEERVLEVASKPHDAADGLAISAFAYLADVDRQRAAELIAAGLSKALPMETEEGTNRIWRDSAGRIACELPEAAEFISALFSPDGKGEAEEATDGKIKLFAKKKYWTPVIRIWAVQET